MLRRQFLKLLAIAPFCAILPKFLTNLSPIAPTKKLHPLQGLSDSDGGFLVPPEYAKELIRMSDQNSCGVSYSRTIRVKWVDGKRHGPFYGPKSLPLKLVKKPMKVVTGNAFIKLDQASRFDRFLRRV